MDSGVRNRILGRRWLFGRDRRRHRSDLNVIGLAEQPEYPVRSARSRGWKLWLAGALTLLVIGAVQGGWVAASAWVSP